MVARQFFFGATLVAVLSVFVVAAGQGSDKATAEFARALQGVTVSLQQGLSAAASTGTPISGKFEIEDGKLQLSVYTVKGKQFLEAIIDQKTGRLAHADDIPGGEDFNHAKAQAAAMGKTKESLQVAVDRVVKANPGSRAVSVAAELEAGIPTAKVTLLRGTGLKTASERLN
jgi:hypothetical protein